MSCNKCNNCGCNNPCETKTCPSNTVTYEGAALECIGVNVGDNLETILSKLEDFVCANLNSADELCSNCINYCGEDVVCDETTIASDGDSLNVVITNIKDFLCNLSNQGICTTDVTYCGTTLECGGEPLASDGEDLDTIFTTICTLIQNASQDIEALDEGVSLTPTMTSINFTGGGATATNVGGAVTVDIPAAGAPVYTEHSDITYSPSFNPVVGQYFTYGELFLHRSLVLINGTGADMDFGSSYSGKYVANVPALDVGGAPSIDAMGYLKDGLGTTVGVSIQADGKVIVNSDNDTVLPDGKALHIIIPAYKYAQPLTILPAPPAV